MPGEDGMALHEPSRRATPSVTRAKKRKEVLLSTRKRQETDSIGRQSRTEQNNSLVTSTTKTNQLASAKEQQPASHHHQNQPTRLQQTAIASTTSKNSQSIKHWELQTSDVGPPFSQCEENLILTLYLLIWMRTFSQCDFLHLLLAQAAFGTLGHARVWNSVRVCLGGCPSFDFSLFVPDIWQTCWELLFSFTNEDFFLFSLLSVF